MLNYILNIFTKEYFNDNRRYIEAIISFFIWLFLLVFGDFGEKFDFANLVYALLGYVVILELVRMIIHYIMENKIKIITVIDTFILFLLREIILVYTGKTYSIEEKFLYIFLGVLTISALFYFRKKSKTEISNKD